MEEMICSQIEGQMFLIEKCKNCKIYLKDYSAAIIMQECEDCEVFIGPCSGSAYIRRSKNCKMIIASAQLRMLLCVNFQVLVFALSEPSLEECSNLKLGCFDFSYPELKRTNIILPY